MNLNIKEGTKSFLSGSLTFLAKTAIVFYFATVAIAFLWVSSYIWDLINLWVL